PLLCEIVRRDPRGHLVLLNTHAKLEWDRRLVARLSRFEPQIIHRLTFLPPQNPDGYLTLLATADVMLDPLHFGGGNTSYEAFAQGTPIVTLPSQLLRGRITLAQYAAMGMDDFVVSTPRQYVNLAVRLGSDADYRRSVRQRIDATSPVLYGNTPGV